MAKTAIEILAELNKLPDTKKLTKKEIEKLSELTDVTVVKSIDASTLSTSDREYSIADLKAWYVPLRQGIDDGKTYEEMKQALLEKRGGSLSAQTDDTELSLAGLDEILSASLNAIVMGRLPAHLQRFPETVTRAINQALQDPKNRTVIVNAIVMQIKEIPMLTLEAKATASKLLPSADSKGDEQ